ncbi:MAG TPA: AI-2E family transporter, partial [Ktedonobacterales bacterium]|nr:AI-2E family transporter [Ktedonobacterales bacterium]
MAEPGFRPQTLLGAMASSPDWARRRDMALAIIGWIVIVGMTIWVASHVTAALLTVIVAALLAYAINPLVSLLGRWIIRPLAIAVAYLIVIAVLGFIGYLIVNATVTQVTALVHQLSQLLSSKSQQSSSGLVKTLRNLGVTSTQIQDLGKQITRNPQQIA